MSVVIGGGSYILGRQILGIYTNQSEVIECGMEILSISTIPYFLCGIMDMLPGAMRGVGYSVSSYGPFNCRYSWDKTCVDIWCIPKP